MTEGEPLTGGSETQGIVRIGDTVRRPLRPFSLTVQAYLAHLRDAGFTGAPLPLGVDEQGREVLSFVPGEAATWPLPPEMWGEDVLAALARLIRALHEASAGWVPPPGAVWGGSPANSGRVTERAELVSHRDYATANVIFRDGQPAALIDFDLARPTSRVYDIVNALWCWAPLREGDPRDRPPALADADIPHRVAVFAAAYGMTAQQRTERADHQPGPASVSASVSALRICPVVDLMPRGYLRLGNDFAANLAPILHLTWPRTWSPAGLAVEPALRVRSALRPQRIREVSYLKGGACSRLASRRSASPRRDTARSASFPITPSGQHARAPRRSIDHH